MPGDNIVIKCRHCHRPLIVVAADTQMSVKGHVRCPTCGERRALAIWRQSCVKVR